MGRVPLLGWGRLVAGCPEEREVRATVRNKGGRRREKFLVKSNNCIGEGRGHRVSALQSDGVLETYFTAT